MADQGDYDRVRRPGIRIPPRLLIAGFIALITVVGYFANSSKNTLTGRTQHIAITPEQEVALGLQSAPEMARQFGGLSADRQATGRVQKIGSALVRSLPAEATAYPFEYHLLADPKTVNAFALPGGQIFITEALYSRLESDGQLAGVLGHETGHVLARHSAAQMAKSQLTQGLAQAVGVAASDSAQGAQNAAQIAQAVGGFINLKYGRDDEIEADLLGLRFMQAAGYDPRSMVRVMEILQEASGGSGGGKPEFMSTHPDPGHRIERIKAWIQETFPGGVPSGLAK
ncbi:MAG: M48 family metalloprotease [Phycisphaerales bacterium]|nr:M48 family metalloprotease [Planctomycetota bacterium]